MEKQKGTPSMIRGDNCRIVTNSAALHPHDSRNQRHRCDALEQQWSIAWSMRSDTVPTVCVIGAQHWPWHLLPNIYCALHKVYKTFNGNAFPYLPTIFVHGKTFANAWSKRESNQQYRRCDRDKHALITVSPTSVYIIAIVVAYTILWGYPWFCAQFGQFNLTHTHVNTATLDMTRLLHRFNISRPCVQQDGFSWMWEWQWWEDSLTMTNYVLMANQCVCCLPRAHTWTLPAQAHQARLVLMRIIIIRRRCVQGSRPHWSYRSHVRRRRYTPVNDACGVPVLWGRIMVPLPRHSTWVCNSDRGHYSPWSAMLHRLKQWLIPQSLFALDCQ